MEEVDPTSSGPQIPGVEPLSKPKRRPRVKPDHPSYAAMVNEAVGFMKDRRGSSRQAIEKYITSKYELGRGSHTRLNTTLNRMVKEDSLVQTKGHGATGSFKINKAQEEGGGGGGGAAAAPAAGGASKPKPKKKAKKKKKKSPKKKKKKSPKKKGGKKKKAQKKKKGGKKKSPKKKKKSPKKKRAPKKKGAKKRKSPKKGTKKKKK